MFKAATGRWLICCVLKVMDTLYFSFSIFILPFIKKNPAPQDSPPAAGRSSDIIPLPRSAILAERFYFIGRTFL